MGTIEALLAAARLATRRHLRAINECDRLKAELATAEQERKDASDAQEDVRDAIDEAITKEASEDV